MSARQAPYDDPIIHAERTQYQEVVLTRSLGRRDVRLFLNGDLQFSSSSILPLLLSPDERRSAT